MTLRRIDLVTLGMAVVGIGVAVAIGGSHMGIGAFCGAVVAVLNFVVLRWIMRKLVQGTNTARGAVALVFPLKFAALFVVCWTLLTRFGVDAGGFAIGLSAVLLGVVVALLRFGEKSALIEKES